MRSFFACLLGVSLLAAIMPASANHPGKNLDKLMFKRSKFFQIIDKPSAPPFELADANGKPVSLSGFKRKVVVLNFVFASCANVCPLHAELIAKIQSTINITAMKDRVQFITITTDPARDTSDVMKGYGSARGLNSLNWIFLTKRMGQSDDITRKIAAQYGVKFLPMKDGQQMHGVVTHIIDRGGRFAAKFHGLKVDPLNVVLYINGLTNSKHPR